MSEVTFHRWKRQTLANGAYWDYDYDPLGQVTAGKKHWVDNAPVAGQQFAYAFDEIGNRLSTQAGGNLRFADYDVNALSMDKFMDDSWEAAKKKAKAICASKDNCCKSVTVRTELAGSAWNPDNWTQPGTKSETIKCDGK